MTVFSLHARHGIELFTPCHSDEKKQNADNCYMRRSYHQTLPSPSLTNSRPFGLQLITDVLCMIPDDINLFVFISQISHGFSMK